MTSKWYAMDHLSDGTGHGDTQLGEESAELTQPQREMIDARIVQSLGWAAGGAFEMVPAGPIAPGVRSAAVLLEGHLPVVISVDDCQAGCVYHIHLYDVYGRRVRSDNVDTEPLARHHHLSEALVAAELGFRLLQHHNQASHAQRFYGLRVGRLPEERWLHEQLCGPAAHGPVA